MGNRYQKRGRISDRKFREVLRLFCADVTALQAAEITRLNRNTTQSIYARLRVRVVVDAIEECRAMAGEIEIDESYFGARRVRGKRGRGAGGKVPVLGLHKRGANVYLSVVEDCSRKSLMPIIQGRVLEGADVYTDGWKAYDGLVTAGYRHRRVHHGLNEFARGKSHVNGIESFWSFAKHRLAKLHGVRKDRFFIHLKECEWRWNHRNNDIYLLLLREIRKTPL